MYPKKSDERQVIYFTRPNNEFKSWLQPNN